MAEQHVVVLTEEAHGRWDLRTRSRRIRKIEELFAVLVAKGHELGPQPFDDFLELARG